MEKSTASAYLLGIDWTICRRIDRINLYTRNFGLVPPSFEQVCTAFIRHCAHVFTVGEQPGAEGSIEWVLPCHVVHPVFDLDECVAGSALVRNKDTRMGSLSPRIWGLHHTECDDELLRNIDATSSFNSERNVAQGQLLFNICAGMYQHHPSFRWPHRLSDAGHRCNSLFFYQHARKVTSTRSDLLDMYRNSDICHFPGCTISVKFSDTGRPKFLIR